MRVTVPRAALHAPRRDVRDAAWWLLVVALGMGVTGVLVAAHARLGVSAAPFTGSYAVRIGPASLLAPAVAAGVIAAVATAARRRVSWRLWLGGGYLAALAWSLALAVVDGRAGLTAPVTGTNGYLADLPHVGDDPLGFLRHFVATAGSQTPAARRHPPGPMLLLWLLHRAGVGHPLGVALVLTALGCLTVPLVAVSVRSLCHERAARDLLPLLVLAPYALWVAVSMDAVTAMLCAAYVACGVVASEPRRSPLWAVTSGLLLGVAALFSYSAPWLAVSLILVYFVRRRPFLNVLTGVGALVPLLLARAAGFAWTAGLSAAQRDLSLHVGPQRSASVWAVLDLVVVVVASGPAIVAATRKVRATPGWPFVVGAGLAVGFAVVSGLSRGEAERSFLPFLPWLLVPAGAPAARQADGGRVGETFPVLLVVTAAAAVVLEAVLRSPW